MSLTEKAKRLRNEYYKEYYKQWRKKNPQKVKNI